MSQQVTQTLTSAKPTSNTIACQVGSSLIGSQIESQTEVEQNSATIQSGYNVKEPYAY